MNAANTSDTFVPDFAHDSQMSLITPSIDDDMVELPLRCSYNEESSWSDGAASLIFLYWGSR